MRGPACFSFFIMLMEEEGSDKDTRFIISCRMQGVSGRYPSGQRGQTVNLLPSASKVRILACPPLNDAGKWRVLNERVKPEPKKNSALNSRRAGVAQW